MVLSGRCQLVSNPIDQYGINLRSREDFRTLIWDYYVVPEQEKRMEAADEVIPPFWAFQIVWKAKDDRKLEVRFDDEASRTMILWCDGPSKPLMTTTASLPSGIDLPFDVADITLKKPEEARPHISCLRIKGRWRCWANYSLGWSLNVWEHHKAYSTMEEDAASGEMRVAPKIRGTDYAHKKRAFLIRPCETCGGIMINARSNKKHCSDACRGKTHYDRKKGEDPNYAAKKKRAQRMKMKKDPPKP